MEIAYTHYKTHFNIGKVKRDFIPAVGTNIRVPNNNQVYVVKHVHIDYECIAGEDYIIVYVKEYKPKFWHMWAK